MVRWGLESSSMVGRYKEVQEQSFGKGEMSDMLSYKNFVGGELN